ncbi:putative PEP-binding protein [Shimia ponticola]|uniref:putative PEP-binding protein n=1 Tax=Shimia ponticola TaxID=2582893 RepID=UPI0011BEF280|nr:putative PEP-binding protein [Shimia ponticola]
MQQHHEIKDIVPITPTAAMKAAWHGGRAKCLQRLIRLDMPVPTTVALCFETVRAIADGQHRDVTAFLEPFDKDALLSVRPSSEHADWGGPGAILNIGMNNARHAELSRTVGETAATTLYLRFIQAYAVHVARLDPDAFYLPDEPDAVALAGALAAYEDEAEEPFPQDIAEQLSGVLRSMARAWNGTSARLLRQAKGAPADAGLGLVIQAMALGVGPGESGAGVIQFVDDQTGAPQVTGRYLSQSQGRDALNADSAAIYLARDSRGQSLQERAPEAFDDLVRMGDLSRQRLREEMQIEFVLEDGRIAILDAIRLPRASRATVTVAVALAQDGIISKAEALMRIEPATLSELLHRQIAPNAPRNVVARGIGASPGAASGKVVFSAAAAQAAQARGEKCVLVRRETGPEDIRGMHAADAVVTERGGITSHAAVIGRGLGLPCVVGASDLTVQEGERRILCAGSILKEGDVIAVDGSTGDIIVGDVPMIEAGLDDSVTTLLTWADEMRDIDIRANADTAEEALRSAGFSADGIGLCRTEHMFFEAERLVVMREMIFADSAEDRRAVLDRLLPMQRADFEQLFTIMKGLPVCVRLLDPPLHEFLPQDRRGLRELASALDLPVKEVESRIEALSEYNPMLGMRGVRLGITVPEIYDMQARAILEAAIAVGNISPEIMIPLISAKREVELVKKRVDAVAAEVRTETGVDVDYSLGVMVETPRAALRSGEIVQNAEFLSFGTNDLTQMTYGLSRDDAGRFMSAYVQKGVYPEDPFHRLDSDGVGELLQLGAERGRAARPDVKLSICGEHGADPEAIRMCRAAGFDYVSCSPFRVPGARLAAAQIAIEDQLTTR